MGNDVFILFIIISMEESAGSLSDEEVTDLGDVRREDGWDGCRSLDKR